MTHFRQRNTQAFKVIFWFYALYLLFVALGYPFISYPPLSIRTATIGGLYLTSLLLGAYTGNRLHAPTPPSLRLVRVSTIILIAFVAIAATLIASWALLVRRYGSLVYILSNAYAIRVSNIGQDTGVLPVYLTYINALTSGVLAVLLAMLGTEGKAKYAFGCAGAFLATFTADLLMFGRIGMLYAIFCIGGFFVVFRPRVLISAGRLLIGLALLGLLLTPRIIRRLEGNWNLEEMYTRRSLAYTKYHFSPAATELIEAYVWYASSIFALDYYLATADIEQKTAGQRTFTPIFRLARRLGIGDAEYVNTIDRHAGNLPFPYNVYTIVRDLYGDFGLVGVALAPYVMGLYFGCLWTKPGALAAAQKIHLLGWLFYTPLYNAFSFGQFVISLAFVLALGLFATAGQQEGAKLLVSHRGIRGNVVVRPVGGRSTLREDRFRPGLVQ